MNLDNLTNAELIRHVDNDPNASELARELANRLDRVMCDIKSIGTMGTDIDLNDGELYDPRPAK